MNIFQFISSFLQQLPEFRGKRRISKLVMDLTGITKGRNLKISTKSGYFRLPNLVEIISFELFVNGSYERGLVELLTSSIPENGIFIDVGANIGSISIPLALARPDIRIISIEASPWIYDVLNENVKFNMIQNITIENRAVFSESNIDLLMYAPKELFGKGSLKPVFTSESEPVKTITVDDLVIKYQLGKVDYMKVDVEGFESCVFRGMENTILKCRPKIVFEFDAWVETEAGFSAGMAQNILLSKGYKLQSLNLEFIAIDKCINEVVKKNTSNILAT